MSQNLRYLIFFACKGEAKLRRQARLQAWLGRTSSGRRRICDGSQHPVDACFEPTEAKRRRSGAETGQGARKGDKKSAKIIGGDVFSAY